MAYNPELADRIRHMLAEAGVAGRTREQKMFGGLSFLVDDAIAVTANNHGDLMARCDPSEIDHLLTRPGASWAEMRGKPMTRGWLRIGPDGYTTDDELRFWIDAALRHNTARQHDD